MRNSVSAEQASGEDVTANTSRVGAMLPIVTGAAVGVAPIEAFSPSAGTASEVCRPSRAHDVHGIMQDVIVIVLVGSKGGTLKTAGAAALAHIYAERGYRVVLVDLDGQGSLTLRSDQQRVADPLTAAPVPLSYMVPGEDGGAARVAVPLAGTVTLYRGGRALDGATTDAVDLYLKRIIQGAADSDASAQPPAFVIVDTPPALGPVTTTAVRHASVIVVPSEPSREGMDGITDVVALHRNLGISAPLHVLVTRVLGLTRGLSAWARTEIARHEHGRREILEHQPALKLSSEIPFTRAGVSSAAFALPVTISARADASSVAWRATATEIVRDVLRRPIRQRRMRPAAAAAVTREVTR